jgi:cell division septal protein FtsQ
MAEPAARRTPAPAGARRSAPPPQRRSRGLRPWLALLFVLAVVAAGFAAYQALQSSAHKTVHLGSSASGNVNDSVDSLKQLIQDNTR